jgi:hypothetical protein
MGFGSKEVFRSRKGRRDPPWNRSMGNEFMKRSLYLLFSSTPRSALEVQYIDSLFFATQPNSLPSVVTLIEDNARVSSYWCTLQVSMLSEKM